MLESKKVAISLGRREALIVFDMLWLEIEGRECANLQTASRDDSELWSLTSLMSRLESRLSEPVKPDYAKLVEKARLSVNAEYGAWYDGRMLAE